LGIKEGVFLRFNYLSITLIVLLFVIMLAPITVSATKTAEQSVSESLTRGSRFTVTITGLPNSSYYIWLPRTFTMSGKPGDQPPVIADSILNVQKDPANGPYTIGSYQYNNGNGQTIRDDIAPSSPEMANTNYYALVTTDRDGRAVVEFQTSLNTGLRSYSIKVESPKSIDSDNLLIETRVYSRKPPTVTSLTQPPTREPLVSTYRETVIASQPPTQVVEPVTSSPSPAATPVPTTKAPAGLYPVTCAVLIAAFCIGIRR
jgi:hypothetical protein